MKPECKYNVEHSFQTIHLSLKTQITVYTHRRTDDMKIPDTIQYQVITLQKLSEHCFHITQRVHKHTTRQINVYYWQNILSHADISKRVSEYYRSTMILKCIFMISTQTSVICHQRVRGTHQATLGSFQHSLSQYPWNIIRNTTPMRI